MLREITAFDMIILKVISNNILWVGLKFPLGKEKYLFLFIDGVSITSHNLSLT